MAHALGLPCLQCSGSGMLRSGWKLGLIRLQTNHDYKVCLSHGGACKWQLGARTSRDLLGMCLIVILFAEKFHWNVWDHAQITAQRKSLIRLLGQSRTHKITSTLVLHDKPSRVSRCNFGGTWSIHTVPLTSIYCRVLGYSELLTAPSETVIRLVKKIWSLNQGTVWGQKPPEIRLILDYSTKSIFT